MVQANFVSFGTILFGCRKLFWGPSSKIWQAEIMELEKSLPTNLKMTYFVFAKAEIIAFEVGTSEKQKNQFFDFRLIERVKEFFRIINLFIKN